MSNSVKPIDSSFGGDQEVQLRTGKMTKTKKLQSLRLPSKTRSINSIVLASFAPRLTSRKWEMALPDFQNPLHCSCWRPPTKLLKNTTMPLLFWAIVYSFTLNATCQHLRSWQSGYVQFPEQVWRVRTLGFLECFGRTFSKMLTWWTSRTIWLEMPAGFKSTMCLGQCYRHHIPPPHSYYFTITECSKCRSV